jgi:hypothetical protein
LIFIFFLHCSLSPSIFYIPHHPFSFLSYSSLFFIPFLIVLLHLIFFSFHL